MPVSFREWAILLLKEYPQGLHYRNMMEILKERNLVETEGRNPERLRD